LSRQRAYQARQQGSNLGSAATHRRLCDTPAKCTTLIQRLLRKSTAQRIRRTAAIATRAGPAQALRHGRTS